MELPELLTVGGASAIVVILLQATKPAMGMDNAAWHRFGALMSIGAGILVTSAGNIALAMPSHPIEAGLAGLLAGASAAGLYQAGSRTSEAIAKRASEEPVRDYDPNG